jgi:hypothetical protein
MDGKPFQSIACFLKQQFGSVLPEGNCKACFIFIKELLENNRKEEVILIPRYFWN